MQSKWRARMCFDPGKGACAIHFYYPNDHLSDWWEIFSLPVAENGEIDCYKLGAMLTLFGVDPDTTEVGVENLDGDASARRSKNRKQKGSNSFKKNYGMLLGFLQGLGFKYIKIASQSWQRSAGKVDLDCKEESIVKCLEIYPQIKKLILSDTKRVYDHNKAEAALLVNHLEQLELNPKKARKK